MGASSQMCEMPPSKDGWVFWVRVPSFAAAPATDFQKSSARERSAVKAAPWMLSRFRTRAAPSGTADARCAAPACV